MAGGRRCHAFLSALQGTFSPIDFNGVSIKLCLCCGKELLNTASWGSSVFVSEQLLAKPLVGKWKHAFSSRQNCKPYLDSASFLFFGFLLLLRLCRFANLAPWLGADFTNPSWATEGGPDLGADYFPSCGTALLAAWLQLISGIQCQPSSCHAGGLSLRAAAAHLPAAGSGSDICSWSQLWAAPRCQSPNASVLDPGARKGFWCQTTAWLAGEGRGVGGSGGIVSFNDGGLGGMEREWQIGRERTSNRSRGKDGRWAWEKTGMAEMERKHEISSDRASPRQGNKGKEAE